MVKEINVEGYSATGINLSWNGDSVVAYTVYGLDSSLNPKVTKGLLAFPYLTPNVSGNTAAGGSGTCGGATDSYDHRTTLPFGNIALGKAYGLRITNLGSASKDYCVGTTTSGVNLPLQGFKITSLGMLIDSGNIQATETKTVIRSLPYLPSIFDFGIFARNEIQSTE